MGKRLSDYAHGDIVRLKENGSLVSFIVAKHDYESGLNGAGRTLLVRKDWHSKRPWDEDEWNNCDNEYSTSAIDTWLNGTYKKTLDSIVQTAIGTTKFYYTPGKTSAATTFVTTLSRGVFLLSRWELGVQDTSTNIPTNKEGSPLPIIGNALIVQSGEWTRTPIVNNYTEAFMTSDRGRNQSVQDSHYVRPCFTLSGDTKFDPDTNEFLEVA